MTVAILLSLAAYLVLLLVIGFRAGRHVRGNPESFFVADRQLNWVQEGLSIFSTAVPGAALLGTVGQFYGLGADFLGYAFGYALFTPVLYWLIGSRMRRLGARFKYQTQADFLRHFFGSRTLAWLVAGLSLILIVPYFSIHPIAVGQTMEAYTGVPYTAGVLIFLVLALSYALYGGLRSVADTDVFHGILLLIFFVLFAVGVVIAAGGASSVFSAPDNQSRLAVTSGAAGVAIFLPWLVQIAFTVVVSPDRALRMYSARDDLNLMRGVLLMASTLAFASASYFVAGLALQVLVPGVEKTDTAVLQGLNENVRWLIPFFVVSVWGSSLAVASMQMLTIANLFIKDVVGTVARWRSERSGKAEASQEMTGNTVFIGRCVMVVCAVASAFIAAGQPIVILEIVGTVFGFWTQVGIVFLFALFWRRATTIGVTSGLVVGLALTALWQWGPDRPFDIVVAGSLEALINAAVVVIVSLLTQGRLSENREHRDALRAIAAGGEIRRQPAPSVPPGTVTT